MSISTKIAVAAAVAALITSPALATDFVVVGQSSSLSMNFAKIEWRSSGHAMESGVIKFTCDKGALTDAWIYAPRDSASGMATGKRQHGPVTFVKEWGAATPQLAAAKGSYNLKSGTKRGTPSTAGWDLATGKGARSSGKTMAMDDWTAISVTGLDAACSPGPGGGPHVK